MLENAGTLALADNSQFGNLDGSIVNDAGATIVYNGSSGGNASINIPVKEKGSITVGGGTLSLTTFAPATTSTLTMSVSATPTHLTSSGVATLKGTLAIQTKPGYQPSIGKKVTVLTASSRTGTFGTFTGTQMTGEHWVVSYTSTSVVLTAVSG